MVDVEGFEGFKPKQPCFVLELDSLKPRSHCPSSTMVHCREDILMYRDKRGS